jgi:hypothetical protein
MHRLDVLVYALEFNNTWVHPNQGMGQNDNFVQHYSQNFRQADLFLLLRGTFERKASSDSSLSLGNLACCAPANRFSCSLPFDG